MNKFYKKFLLVVFIVLVPLSCVKLFNLDRNEKVLNTLAGYVFDEQYYLAAYPEVLNSGMTPFQHYSTIGWKEKKNPNKDFDTQFVMMLYPEYKKYYLNPLQYYLYKKLSFKTQYTNSSQINKVDKLLESSKYYISLAAIFRNDGRFLKEWIEFYKIIGVEHFYLYNHLSNDNFREVLEPYIREGLVELVDLTQEPKTNREWNKIQTGAYSDAVIKSQKLTEWLIVVDTDEFLFPLEGESLRPVLEKYDEYASLAVNWKVYGSGKVSRIPEDKLLIETLNQSYADSYQDLCVKVIVKPRYVDSFTNPHYANLKNGYYQVNEKYVYFKGAFLPSESRDVLRINHYWARDYEFFNSTKIARVHMIESGLSEKEKQEKINNFIKMNAEASVMFDGSILRFVPQLRAKLFNK